VKRTTELKNGFRRAALTMRSRRPIAEHPTLASIGLSERRAAHDQVIELGYPAVFFRAGICSHLRGLTNQDLFRIGGKLCHGFLDEIVERYCAFARNRDHRV
jgi:hypothetical protein